ncbi:MAG: carboxyl transferase domain-containing protein [Caldisericota bacterium]|nr:carboxyl transferase domain-containing protein [Caldisericota bacterium]
MTNGERYSTLRSKRAQVIAGGGPDRVSRQHAAGKLTARERIDLLLDNGSFQEENVFVSHRNTGFGLDTQELPGDGVVTGHGLVNGRLVFIYSQDFTIAGGSLGEMHAAKIARVQDLALKFGAPIVSISDSGGARIQEGIDSLKGYAGIFYRNTISSGVVPQISMIAGPCAGGAVYSPGIMDFVVMTEQARMFITGPKVIQSVTGEEVTDEELGGLAVHAEKSGNVHLAAESDQEAIALIRQLLSYLPSNNAEDAPFVETKDPVDRATPEIGTIIPDEANKPYDVRKVIMSISDGGAFFEIGERFAQSICIGFTRVGGQVVGVVANQSMHLAGVLDIDSSDKAARFVRFCDAFNIPLLTLVDVGGYLPGVDQEYGGIIRHGAKLLYAFSECTVPKVTVILRKAYGGAYIAMSCRDLGADFVYALPSAEIAVMGADGAATIIFAKEIREAADPEATRQRLVAEYKDKLYNPYVAGERGLVDDILEPAELRKRIVWSFRAAANKREDRPARKHGNIPL